MIPGIDLVTFVQAVSIFGVAFVIFAESGLLIGFFLPGDSLLFTAGFLMFTGVLNVHLLVALPILFAAAVLGDTVGYIFGRRAGPRIFSKPDARLFKTEYISRAQDFYDKYGAKTIILARFIPVVRTFAPIVAGAGKMPYRRFISFNLIGGLLWTSGVTLAGYFLGRWFEMIGLDIDQVIYPIVGIIIIISVLPPAIHIFKERKNRQAFASAVSSQFRSLFRRSK